MTRGRQSTKENRMSSAVSVTGLRKAYGKLVVLDGIDLDVAGGTIFGLLGPNGAGKTTTVEILTTLQHPDAGNALVAGHDLGKDPNGVRSAIGVTGQFSAVDNILTGEENLGMMADLRHLGKDPNGVRSAIGVTGQFSAVDNMLTGEENLGMMADLRHLGKGERRRRVR